jgi:hypothetical protein
MQLSRMIDTRIATLAFALSACAALGQEPAQATLTVTVADQSGARISAARVQATNESTGAIFAAEANADGEAVVPLKPGVYFLRVHAKRFMIRGEKDVEVTKETLKAVSLAVDDPPPWGGPGAYFPVEITLEHQQLEADIPLIPMQPLIQGAKPLRTRHHWL